MMAMKVMSEEEVSEYKANKIKIADSADRQKLMT